MKKLMKYFLFPLSLLAVWFAYLFFCACYHKFWLDFDPKGIYTMGMILWIFSFFTTVIISLLIRSFVKIKVAFGIEVVLLLTILVWCILANERQEIVSEGANGRAKPELTTNRAIEPIEVTRIMDDIVLANFSFENGDVGIDTLPFSWTDCADSDWSTPDSFEKDKPNTFLVANDPIDGTKYVGLVVRADGTRECIRQNILPSRQGEYQLEAILSRSDTYIGWGREEERFNSPTVLEIYGVDLFGVEKLLHKTEIVESTSWKVYRNKIYLDEDVIGIKLTPNYSDDDSKPYNGNILIDRIIIY